jgi:hypothetical protein
VNGEGPGAVAWLSGRASSARSTPTCADGSVLRAGWSRTGGVRDSLDGPAGHPAQQATDRYVAGVKKPLTVNKRPESGPVNVQVTTSRVICVPFGAWITVIVPSSLTKDPDMITKFRVESTTRKALPLLVFTRTEPPSPQSRVAGAEAVLRWQDQTPQRLPPRQRQLLRRYVRFD